MFWANQAVRIAVTKTPRSVQTCELRTQKSHQNATASWWLGSSRRIVAASNLPLSIIIVGVGNADFSTMEFLVRSSFVALCEFMHALSPVSVVLGLRRRNSRRPKWKEDGRTFISSAFAACAAPLSETVRVDVFVCLVASCSAISFNSFRSVRLNAAVSSS